ncbi:MAG: DUF1905 domain-containing protein [Chloroflexi bacterium]|jgi:hypothetical protein|uniref:DUF1905 domain-containing protein n=1 Tax=Candidatus Chlorohelix allophototropha TaxID=3003348 RepID=A0A8T7M9J3_9CHLR|nr:DUF1905 domain-containing protein [Chloroflexota bacterium]WJW68731.1 YdeI/OmpD-associated family protein [Chloroflexota bacterium L227-S17]
MQFRAKVQLHGKTATGVEVPEEIVKALGSSKRPAVNVTINGYTYRSSIAFMGGVFLLGISAENRLGAGVAAGDEVDITVELDTAPREVTLPPDFAELLEQDTIAKQFFDSLSYSHKRQYLLWIEGTKKAETRQQRIVKAVGMLREGRTQS